jgi:hypothetical protein
MGTDADPFYGAPAVLIVLADKSVPTHVYDGSLVMGNIIGDCLPLPVAAYVPASAIFSITSIGTGLF